jgi:hypothetical protein
MDCFHLTIDVRSVLSLPGYSRVRTLMSLLMSLLHRYQL